MRADDRFLELMHAEMDGEASERERADLLEYLASSPVGRKTQGELARLADLLNQVEGVEPPADLKQSIMNALPSPRPAIDVVAHHKPWHARLSTLKYGYALAAGLLLGLALARIAFWNISVSEPSDLFGTMTAKEHPVYRGSDQMKLDLADLRGSVVMVRSNSDIIVNFDLHSAQRTAVVALFPGGRYAFRGFDQQSTKTREFMAGQDRVTFEIEGKCRSTLVLTSSQNTDLIIDLKFLISGRIVQTGTLRLPKLP